VPDLRSEQENAAQAALEAALASAGGRLRQVGLRAELQPVHREKGEGPYSSEVSALVWLGDNVVDCRVYPAWSHGGPLAIEEIERMIKEDIERLVSAGPGSDA
jgi:hypothetical protein